MEIVAPRSLEEFESTAGARLEVYLTLDSMDLLVAICGSCHAHRITTLHIEYIGTENRAEVGKLVPPGLEDLRVDFRHVPETSFLVHALACSGFGGLAMTQTAGPHSKAFFLALPNSRVTKLLTKWHAYELLDTPFFRYLAKNRLGRLFLEGSVGDHYPCTGLLEALADCTHLVELVLIHHRFPEILSIPKSVHKLAFNRCCFRSDEKFRFLAASAVQDLTLVGLGDGLGWAAGLQALLQTRTLHCLRVRGEVDVGMVELGDSLARIRAIDGEMLGPTAVAAIAHALTLEGNLIRELSLPLVDYCKKHLKPVVSHPNCRLERLVLGGVDMI